MKHLVMEHESLQPEIYKGSRVQFGNKSQQPFKKRTPNPKWCSLKFTPAVQHHQGCVQICWHITWSTSGPWGWGNAAGNLLGHGICPWPRHLPLATAEAIQTMPSAARRDASTEVWPLQCRSRLNTSKYLLMEANSITAKSLTTSASRNHFGKESCESRTPGRQLLQLGHLPQVAGDARGTWGHGGSAKMLCSSPCC